MDDINRLIDQTLELRRLAGGIQLPEVLVMGPVNSGKSTLINGLLKNDLSPTDASPSTFLPIRIIAGNDYTAEVIAGGKAKKVANKKHLSDLVRKRISIKNSDKGSDRIEIRHHAGILEWCSLIDTPGSGLSEETDRMLEKMVCGRTPGEIIFMLHQRGIDASAYGFLEKLHKAVSSAGKEISFWINVNTGYSDGTPLPETRERVRRLFPGRSIVHLINTRNPKSIEIISLYLKTKIAGNILRNMGEKLRDMDNRLPARLNKVSKIKDDSKFLMQIWGLNQEARSLLAAREAIDSLPLVGGRIKSLLEDHTRRLILLNNPFHSKPPINGAKTPPHRELEHLLEQMAGDKSICRIIPAGSIKALGERLREEKCRIEVVGTFSSGKTTFLNALVGEPLLTAGDQATTACRLLLRHGPSPKAVLETMLQPEFQLVQKEKGTCRLLKGGFDSLQSLLRDNTIFQAIADVEIALGNQFLRISRDKLEEVLYETYKRFNTTGKENRSISSLLPKLLTKQQRMQDNKLLTAVRLTFRNPFRFVFDLSKEAERKKFEAFTLPPYAAIAERIEVDHPSLPLKNAVFLDTPGSDSLHRQHLRQKPGYREHTDILLVFMHGKHLTAEGPETYSHRETGRAGTGVYYVINFADTMDQMEREKASLFVRLKMPAHKGSQPLPYAQVHMISALQAMQGEDDGFRRLVRQLAKTAGEHQHKLQAEVTGQLKNLLLDAAGSCVKPYSDNIIEKYLEALKTVEPQPSKTGTYRLILR
jgi:GTPase Era involved in 16S rRNA processing